MEHVGMPRAPLEEIDLPGDILLLDKTWASEAALVYYISLLRETEP